MRYNRVSFSLVKIERVLQTTFLALLPLLSFSCTSTNRSGEPLEALSFYETSDDAEEAILVLQSRERRSEEEDTLLLSLYLANNDFEKAVDHLAYLEERYPKNREVLYQLAFFENIKGNRESRDSYIDRLLALDPEDSSVNSLLGDIAFNSKNYSEAARYYEISLKSDSQFYPSLLGAGRSYMHMKKSEKALQFYKDAETVYSEDPYLYVEKSKNFRQMKQYLLAEEALTTAITLDPESEWHYLDRAKIRILHLNRKERALNDVEKVLEINGENFFAHVYAAGIYFDLKDFENSFYHYKRVYQLRPDYPFSYTPLGMFFYVESEYDKAISFFDKAIGANPGDFGSYFMIALSLYQQGRKEEARRWMAKYGATQKVGTLTYELSRYYTSSASNLSMGNLIQSESSPLTRNRVHFYMGAYDRIVTHQRASSVLKGLIGEEGSFEFWLAELELNRYEG